MSQREDCNKFWKQTPPPSSQATSGHQIKKLNRYRTTATDMYNLHKLKHTTRNENYYCYIWVYNYQNPRIKRLKPVTIHRAFADFPNSS